MRKTLSEFGDFILLRWSASLRSLRGHKFTCKVHSKAFWLIKKSLVYLALLNKTIRHCVFSWLITESCTQTLKETLTETWPRSLISEVVFMFLGLWVFCRLMICSFGFKRCFMVKFFISAQRIQGTLHTHMVSTSRLSVGLLFSITCLIVLFDSN